MLQCNIFPGLPPDFLDSEVNLFLVPFMDSEAESENPPRAGTPWGYPGHGETTCPGLGPFSGPHFSIGEVREELVWGRALKRPPHVPGPGSSPLFSLLPGYRGHPSFQSLVSKLRSQVMSMARPQLSHTILTEKNW